MPLYFDTYDKMFCTESNSNTNLICSDIFENTRQKGKDTPPVVYDDGKYKFQIDAFFDSNDEQRSYVRAKVFVNGLLMLPISQYNPNKTSVRCLSSPECYINYFNQWYHKGPYTIVQGAYRRSNPISNERLFAQICDICNETKRWVENEICTLVENYIKYENKHKSEWIHPCRLASSILLIQRYEQLVSIYSICGKNFENACLNTLKNGLEYMLSRTNNAENTRIEKEMKEYDVIWQYVKDSHIHISK